jgi:hypothetical protein
MDEDVYKQPVLSIAGLYLAGVVVLVWMRRTQRGGYQVFLSELLPGLDARREALAVFESKIDSPTPCYVGCTCTVIQWLLPLPPAFSSMPANKEHCVPLDRVDLASSLPPLISLHSGRQVLPAHREP